MEKLTDLWHARKETSNQPRKAWMSEGSQRGKGGIREPQRWVKGRKGRARTVVAGRDELEGRDKFEVRLGHGEEVKGLDVVGKGGQRLGSNGSFRGGGTHGNLARVGDNGLEVDGVY